MEPIDVVYICRAGDRNEELRYSLRGLAANVPHANVWFAGYMPKWVRGCRCLPVVQAGTKWENSAKNVERAARHPKISERFIVMNDDFFALRPIDRIEPGHRGLISDLVSRVAKSRYAAGLRATDDLLTQWGITNGLAYTLHEPLIVHKAGIVAMLERVNRTPMARQRRVLSWRSLFGNMYAIGGEQHVDNKVHHAGDEWDPARDWLSTNDASFLAHPAGEHVRNLYPNPGPYEEAPR